MVKCFLNMSKAVNSNRSTTEEKVGVKERTEWREKGREEEMDGWKGE